jgi:large subunit ribosomal protein L29
MKTKDLKNMETGHLHHELTEKQRHLFDLRTQSVTEKLEDPSQLGKTRKEIARLKTILRERQLAEAKGASTKPTVAAPVAGATGAGEDETVAVSQEVAK